MWGRFVYREIVAPERKPRVTVEWIPYDATEGERKTFEVAGQHETGLGRNFDQLDAYLAAGG